MIPSRLSLAVSLVSVALGACASAPRELRVPPGGFYRIPGLAPTPVPTSAEEGAQRFRLEPGGHRVELVVEAALVAGEVRLVAALENHGREPVRYDLRRAAIRAADGTALELASFSEDPSRRPSTQERAAEEYRAGVRRVERGERDVITRRYRLPDAARGDAARLLATLDLADELVVGELPERIGLHLEKVR